MRITFDNIITLIADSLFNGSTTLASLAILIAIWAICAVIFINAKAPAVYSIVPMIPIAVFFSAYGVMDPMVAGIIVVVTALLAASEFKKVVD